MKKTGLLDKLDIVVTVGIYKVEEKALTGQWPDHLVVG